MKRYKYNILGLDCANCAREVEEELNKNPKFSNVIVNFSTSKLSFDSDEDIDLSEINELVKMVEPEAIVSHEDKEMEDKEYNLLLLIIDAILGVVGCFWKAPFEINLVLLAVGYICLIYRHFVNAIKVLIKNKQINENALIVISSLGAFCIGETFEGIIVVFLYGLGKFLEEKAINKTRSSVKSLLDIKQSYANKLVNEEVLKVDVNEIDIGDTLVVKKGERIPVDCTLTKGNATLDLSALTGESELVLAKEGDALLSGAINNGDVIEIKATEKFENSTVSRILSLIEDATDKKAKAETTVSKISKVYTPIVFLLAIATAILLPLLTSISFNDSLYRGLTFLVISCPCAIAISVPLSYFVGIGVASRNNILIKGSNYLDNLKDVEKMIFDKTGTLTTGAFSVKNIEIIDKSYSMEQVIDIITKGEALSNHPIAKSIMKLRDNVRSDDVCNYTEISGKGIAYEVFDKQVKIGTSKLCDNCEIETNVHINIDGKHIASIIIDDGIKTGAKEMIEKLHKLGIKTYMFTGDKKEVALEISEKLGIDETRYEMLPQDKFSEYEKISTSTDKIAFVGDGINDAPVLKRAYIGISMGEIGSAAAIEASDIIVMKDDLSKIPEAIELSKCTNRIIKQNLAFAISVKIIILLLNLFGVVSMWMAVFADTGVTVITIINTLRLLKLSRK